VKNTVARTSKTLITGILLNDYYIVVSRETRNIDRKPKIVIVVKPATFGESVVYCAERYAKVKVQGEPDGSFDKKMDLPMVANAPTFSVDDLNKPIDIWLSAIDKMGRSTRSEDIPAAGAPIDCTTNLHGKKWGWGGMCLKLSIILK
jgi:hypothetical protein